MRLKTFITYELLIHLDHFLVKDSEYMASDNVLEYGDYEYDWTYEYDWDYWYNYWYNYYLYNYTWSDYENDYNWTSRMDNPNARSDSMEDILARIVDCNYTPKEHENTGRETRNQTMNKVNSIKRNDLKSVCGIKHADLKEAMKYVQAGFQIA